VYGGHLSALVLGRGELIPAGANERRSLIHQVSAAREYYRNRFSD